ncbi:hypothetical protein [Microbacterium sp. NPDC056057]|uniref:hypothetical protein n=1 Tax=Microbacterium sp. NPDC056057 TaxID=3345699 RepID=UPI0035E048C1
MNKCPHGLDSSYDFCEPCLAALAEGDAVLGRFQLVGPGAGLAVDFKDGRVTVYMVNADTVVSGGGGMADGWVTFDEQATSAPDVELHPPVDPSELGDASPRDLADLCEHVSEFATEILPFLESEIDRGTSAEEILRGFVWWLDQRGTKPLARRVFWAAVQVLIAAALAYGHQEEEL